MLSHTPEGRGSQPGQRGVGRDHPRSDKRVQTPGGGPQSERLPMASPAMRGRGRGQGYFNMGDRGPHGTGGQHVSPMNANNNNMSGSFRAVTESPVLHMPGSPGISSMESISGMGSAQKDTRIVPDLGQMPQGWQQEFDTTAFRQDQLIGEWLRITSNSDNDKARYFLQNTRWILRDAVDLYWKASMTRWVDHFMMCTQSNDEAVVIQFIQRHHGDVEQAILTWQRETAQAQSRSVWGIQSDAGAAGGLFPRDNRGGQDNVRYTSQPQFSPPAAWSPLQIGSHQQMLGTDEEHGHIPVSKAMGILLQGRIVFSRMPAPRQAECARDTMRNFRLESVRPVFKKATYDKTSPECRDLLVNLSGQIAALMGCHPENENLILMWMAKHFEEEAMVQWQLAYGGAMKEAPEGHRIEYVINALAKAYADPLAATTARMALKQLKWPERASVQHVLAKFEELKNTYESAVEDTVDLLDLEKLDPIVTKEWLLRLQEIWPPWVGRLHANHPMEFTDAGRMFAFVIRREAIDKPNQVGSLNSLSTRTNAEVMEAILQEQPEALEAILQDAGVGGLLALMVSKIRCWRCAGSHCKYQCTAKASPQELAGEKDRTMWGFVPPCFVDTSKPVPRKGVFTVTMGETSAPDDDALVLAAVEQLKADFQVQMQEIRTDMREIVQVVKESHLEVEGALNALTQMAGSLNALALNVQGLQH
jgi:hypothetical protein